MTDDPMPCQKCGQAHARCTGHRRDGQPCTQWRMTGQTVCKQHGGMSPAAREKGQVRVVEQRLRALLKDMGTEPVTQPALELARLAGEAVGWKDFLLTKVDELSTLTTTNVAMGEQAKAVVTLLTAARKDTAKVLTDMTRLNLDATALGYEMSRASREQAESLNRILVGLQLTEEQQARLPELFRKEGLTP